MWFLIVAITFIATECILINYKVEKLTKSISISEEWKLELMSQINQKISINDEKILKEIQNINTKVSKHYSDIDYDTRTYYKDLKADILHNAAEFYRLRDQLNDLKAKEEGPPSSATPPTSPRRNVRPKVVLVEEGTLPPQPAELPPQRSEPKTSDTPP